MKSGGHKGYSLARRPKSYTSTPQQGKFRAALEACGIKKGISKKDLQMRMRDCLPKYFEEHKDGKDLHV